MEEEPESPHFFPFDSDFDAWPRFSVADALEFAPELSEMRHIVCNIQIQGVDGIGELLVLALGDRN